MIPSQRVCNLYLTAVNLKFGLEITSENNMKACLFTGICMGNELGIANIWKKPFQKVSFSGHYNSYELCVLYNSMKLQTTHVSWSW